MDQYIQLFENTKISPNLKQKLKNNVLTQNPLKKNHREFIDILYFLEEILSFDSNDFMLPSSLWNYIEEKLNVLTKENILELENKLKKL